VGSNPFKGNSHLTKELDDEMREYYTQERMIEVLFRCEQEGMTTMQSRGDYEIMDMIAEYRRQGGKMHWICQTASEWDDIDENIRVIADHDPIAIYHHGTNTDKHFKAGTNGVVLHRLELIRNLGLLAGLASHMPECFEWVEQQGWPVDFYMCSFYNLSRDERESKIVGGKFVNEDHLFVDSDRARMCEFIQGTSKQVLAYKILGAGRKCKGQQMVREAFGFAFERIKPNDAVIVGFYPRRVDDVALDCGYVRDICGVPAG
jgi:hypothetical protein